MYWGKQKSSVIVPRFKVYEGATLLKQKGFSLVETIISLLVFSIALLALVQVPALYSKLMSMSVEKENATLHAIHALDTLETIDYEDLDDTSSLENSLIASIDLNTSAYSLVLSIVPANDDTASSKTLTVQVSKVSGIGKEDVTLTRVVSPFADKTVE